MKCGLISDLHLEEFPCYVSQERGFYKNHPEIFDSIFELEPPSQKLDILFVAGDFCEFRHQSLWFKMLDKVSHFAEMIVFVDGNHEHWRTRYQKMPEFVEALKSRYDNIEFLCNESFVYKNLEVFGTCLWTDFGFNEYIMQTIGDKYSPLRVDKNLKRIKWQQGGFRNARARDIQLLSMKAKKETVKWLSKSKGTLNKRLLLTHYPPLPDAVYIDDDNGKIDPETALALSKIELTDLSDELIDHTDVVIAHGHLHSAKSYASKTGHKVYCNPRGILNKMRPKEYRVLEFEV
ncbi:metallophosphoesterase [Vibrio crassostreae]|uniref:metallophosphoesterase n=1 Tax=Vibrio crassostreae TaxID=246167 RepID=UPI001B317118|nr:metallophosphoesterase [Vibrio crassostreae]